MKYSCHQINHRFMRKPCFLSVMDWKRGCLLPSRSCGRTTQEHDSWTAPCSRRWRCSGPVGSEPQTFRSWPARPGTHAAPGMGASWVGRWTRPVLKALILAWVCYSNQTQWRGFPDPDWQGFGASPLKKNNLQYLRPVCRQISEFCNLLGTNW